MATIYHDIFIENAQFLTTFPQVTKINGSNFPVSGLAFDAATDEAAFWKFRATAYGSGNLTLDVYWYADTASSGDVVWGASIAAITPNTDSQDVETDALTTENTATDSHLGTTGQRVHHIAITISNLDSIASGDLVFLRVRRPASTEAADTMTGDAILLFAVLSYSDT